MFVENNNIVGTCAKINSGPIRLNNKIVSFNGVIEDNYNFNEDVHKKRIFGLLKVNLEIISKKHMKERSMVSQTNEKSKAG